jgi:hypothetical protein
VLDVLAEPLQQEVASVATQKLKRIIPPDQPIESMEELNKDIQKARISSAKKAAMKQHAPKRSPILTKNTINVLLRSAPLSSRYSTKYSPLPSITGTSLRLAIRPALFHSTMSTSSVSSTPKAPRRLMRKQSFHTSKILKRLK